MYIDQTKFETVIDAFEYVAIRKSDAICFLFPGEQITYGRLLEAVRKLATNLSVRKLKGQTVLIVSKTSFEFMVQFLACVYAGAIPVPSYHPDENNLFSERFSVIVEKGSIHTVLTNEENRHLICSFVSRELASSLSWISTDTLPASDETMDRPNCSEPAFIQFSSGSTGDPKGIIVSHSNVLFNVKTIASILSRQAKDGEAFVGVNWLPLYHDMGLVGAFLTPLLAGFPMSMLMTNEVMGDPSVWIKKLSETKAKMTLAPNFAYDRCVEAFSGKDKSHIDLSNLEVAFNGGEHVSYDTIIRFYDCFKDCGLRLDAMYPSYGLAEATLIVTSSKLDGSAILHTDRNQLRKMVIKETLDDADAFTLVDSGELLPDIQVVILNVEDNFLCADMEIGEIMVSSDSVARGYCGNRDSSACFHMTLPCYTQTFLQTGDLGFIKDNHLYIVGRLKDVIIFNGKNIDPRIVESTVIQLDERLSQVGNAAFSIQDINGDNIILIQELPESMNAADLREKIIRKVQNVFNFTLSNIVFLRPGEIIRTAIGKVSRKECKNKYIKGEWI